MGTLFSACREDHEEIPLLVPCIPRSVQIIGVAGKAGSGKDTLADFLVQSEGFTRFAFADPLKLSVCELFGIPLEHMNHPISKERVDETWRKSPRQLMQWLGDCVRNDISKDFFVIMMANRINESQSKTVVISDVRYEQEARFVREMGGVIVELARTNRFGSMGEKEANHSSESGLPRILVDYHISNDGSKETLYRVAKNTLMI